MTDRRLTYHSKRCGKDGSPFNANHNDRTAERTGTDKHIDESKSAGNLYLTCYDDGCSFREAEQRYYAERFEAYINRTNENYIKQRHPERCKTTDDILNSTKTCPRETLIYIGNLENQIPQDDFIDVYDKYLRWKCEQFPQVHILDTALHVDELGADHIHERETMFYIDADGVAVPNQKKALEQMEIPLPHPELPEDRKNNRLQTYTKLCREKLQELAREHGYEINLIPRDPKRSGKDLNAYIIEKAMEDPEQFKRNLKADMVLAVNKAVNEKTGIDKGNEIDINRFLQSRGLYDEFHRSKEELEAEIVQDIADNFDL